MSAPSHARDARLNLPNAGLDAVAIAKAREAAYAEMYGDSMVRRIMERGGDDCLDRCVEAAVLAYLTAKDGRDL